MYCKNCGKQISDTAKFCEHCGAAISYSEEPHNKPQRNGQTEVLIDTKDYGEPKKPFYKKTWFVVIVVVFAIWLFWGESAHQKESDPPQTPTGTVVTTGNTKNDGIYREGMYAVGTDIEPGEYYIYCSNNVGCYFAVYKDSSGTIDSIIANENITSFAFVTVEKGQYLQVKRGNFIDSSKAVLPKAGPNGFYVAGMYRVGIDIPAGEYKIVADTGDMAYVAVYKDSSNTMSSIVANEIFENSYYISVVDGQYLYIKRGAFKLAK
jgi:hypothetical protein